MERWTWDGATWTRAEVLKTEVESGLPVNFPFVPVGYDAEIKVIFAEWGANIATNAPVPAANLYGWGTGGFVDAPSPTRYVETVTDNANVAAGSVQLESVTADLFANADTDGDTFRWDPVAGSGCYLGVVAGTISRSVVGGALSLSSTSGTNACRAGVRLSVSVTGDWDFRIRQDRGASGAGRIWEMHVINDARVGYCADSGTADGILYQAPAEAGVINAFTCVNGAFAQVGANTAEPGDPQYYRLTRSTNTFTWYYSSDGAAWTQDEQTTNVNIGNPVYFLLTAYAGTPSGTTTAADYDNFLLASGTVSQGGYRRSGSWTTPTTILAGQRISTVTLGHSSLSATAYIDRVDVLVESAIVWSSTTDITSGTQTILVPAQDVDGATAVRVTLASDGASSPILESVEYVYEDSSTPPVSQTFLVDFTYRVEGDTVRFLDLTRNVSGLGLSYRWQFGDGAESFVREAWHVYPPTIWGTYAVTLTVCDPFVCKSASRNVTIVQWDIVMLVVIVAAIAFTYAWVRKTERRERRARVSGRRE
jgi:hypothetical protein